ncbi:MAG TPA: hypothetical protein VFU19_14950 [Iamia sp.]|nr:hypothetical protein [Iamia sp.]
MSRRARLGWLATLLVATLVAPLATPGSVVPAGAVPPPATDPGVLGARPVEELTYDLGAEAFAPEALGARVELRGKVYAPSDGTDAGPLVVLLHGRHATCGGDDPHTVSAAWPCPPGVPEIPSYKGYDALGRNLASHGSVVVSIGANGVNANDAFIDDGGAAARAELVMETLRRFQAWGASATGSPFGSRFVGRIDTSRVALMGHSRGGEGVVAAAALNQAIGSPFGIRAVLALAPVDFARRVLTGVPLGVVLPDCDGDVSDLQGADYFDDARYAVAGDPAARSVFHVRGANHNAFNTVWTVGPGSGDDAEWSERSTCQPGANGRLTPAQQEAAGAALMAGYIRRYLTDETGFQRLVTGAAPVPPSAAPARWTTAYWSPDRLDVARWDSAASARRSGEGVVTPPTAATPGVVCNPSSRDMWGESRARIDVDCPGVYGLGMINDTGTYDLGWTSRGVVVRRPLAPGGVDVTAYDGLRFRAAAARDSRNRQRHAQDLSVVLEDTTGATASASVRAWSPALNGPLAGHPGNVVLAGVRIPLSAFAGVDLTRIRAVELRTDRTDAGRIHLADLAFTAEGTAEAAGPAMAGGRVTSPCLRTAESRFACAVSQAVHGRDLAGYEVDAVVPLLRTAAGRRAYVTLTTAGSEAFEVRLLQHLQRLTQAPIETAGILPMLPPAQRRSWETAQTVLADELMYSFPTYASPEQIVDGLYETHLGARADAAGRSYWVGRIGSGAARPSDLSRSLRRSAAARRIVVVNRYRQLVGYSPDSASVTYWSGRLLNGGGERALVVELMSTARFHQLAGSTT